MNTRARSKDKLSRPGTSLDMAKLCAAAALDKKAMEPVLLDVARVTGYADYFLLLSGRSTRQAAAVANEIVRLLKQAGVRPLGTEGLREGSWALVDYGDVVVHVFHQPVREFYDLESLWGDAPVVDLDPAELEALLPRDRQ